MNHNLVVSRSVDVAASPEKVWEAMTNPEIIKEYLFGTHTVTDWKPGSDIIFQGEWQGQVYKDKGVVKENIPLKRISYTYWSAFTGLEDIPANYSLVTMELEPLSENLTRFTWTQKGFGSEEGYNHSLSGIEAFMDSIKAVMER